MKIIVLMKQVASKDAILRINKSETWIEESDLSFEVSESDGYALEEALRVREKLTGEVVVCSMGPARVKSVIKDALARGADRAIHVTGDNLGNLSPYAAASALAHGPPRLVLPFGRRRNPARSIVPPGRRGRRAGHGQAAAAGS